ncbi:MAG: hypothetical protein RIC36_19605 [Rhodospirillales bacterium]
MSDISERLRRLFIRRRDSYRDCFRGPSGERVLADLAAFCNWNVAIPPGDAPAMAYEEGKRRVFLRIKSLAEMDDRRLSRLMDDGEDDAGG